MTQRFGRNKRRAAREAIAAAQHETAVFSAALDCLRDKVAAEQRRRRDAERLLGEIRERLLYALGDKTALLPVDLLPVQKSTLEPWMTRVDIPAPVSPFCPSDAAIDMFEMRENTVENLLHLVIRVEKDPYRHARDIRFLNGSNDGRHGKFAQRGYIVSEHALQRIGFMGKDYNRLAMVIARELVDVEYRR